MFLTHGIDIYIRADVREALLNGMTVFSTTGNAVSISCIRFPRLGIRHTNRSVLHVREPPEPALQPVELVASVGDQRFTLGQVLRLARIAHGFRSDRVGVRGHSVRGRIVTRHRETLEPLLFGNVGKTQPRRAQAIPDRSSI